MIDQKPFSDLHYRAALTAFARPPVPRKRSSSAAAPRTEQPRSNGVPVFTERVPAELIQSLLDAAIERLPDAHYHPDAIGIVDEVRRKAGREGWQFSLQECGLQQAPMTIPLFRVEGLAAELAAAESLVRAIQAWRQRAKQGKRRVA